MFTHAEVFLREGRLRGSVLLPGSAGAFPREKGRARSGYASRAASPLRVPGACGESRAGEARDFELICQQTTEPSGSEYVQSVEDRQMRRSHQLRFSCVRLTVRRRAFFVASRNPRSSSVAEPSRGGFPREQECPCEPHGGSYVWC